MAGYHRLHQGQEPGTGIQKLFASAERAQRPSWLPGEQASDGAGDHHREDLHDRDRGWRSHSCDCCSGPAGCNRHILTRRRMEQVADPWEGPEERTGYDGASADFVGSWVLQAVAVPAGGTGMR